MFLQEKRGRRPHEVEFLMWYKYSLHNSSKILIYIYKALCLSVRLSVCYVFVCPRGTNNLFVPRGTNISHTQVGGGTNKLFVPGGQTFLTHKWGGGQTNCLSPGDKHFLHTEGGTNIFLMMMITVGNVSGANILSSEARKPPAGARIPGPVGP